MFFSATEKNVSLFKDKIRNSEMKLVASFSITVAVLKRITIVIRISLKCNGIK